MKQYNHVVWDFIEIFDYFNIFYYDRNQNFEQDRLEVLGSRFENFTISPYFDCDIEVRSTPYVLDNVIHWKVFDDDA